MISFIGGSYDKKQLQLVYPTPHFVVLGFGTELYERLDPPGVVEATYKLADDWSAYRENVKNHKLI